MSLLINHFYRFGEFTLDTDQGILLREGKPVPLAPKVFDTLLVLLENPGRIVTKEELMNRVWPDTFVEEDNLTYNIKQLRKTFDDDARNPVYIETIARRGYRFIADVEEVLMDSGAMNEQITRRLEISEARSPDATGAIKPSPEAHEEERTIAFANENQYALPKKDLYARPAAGAASTGVSKNAIALAAAMVIILTGVGMVLWKFTSGSSKNPTETAAPPFKLEKLTGTGLSRLVAISPDGKYIAYTQVVDKKSAIWLRQLSTNTNVEIVPPTGAIFGLAFANSGEYLFFVKRSEPIAELFLYQTGLYRISLLGGVATKIVDSLEGNFSVSADDSQISFIRESINRDGQREYSLIIANSDGTGQRRVSKTNHPDSLYAPLWSPDGGSIICAYGYSEAGGEDVRIVEVRVADGTRKELSSDRFFRIAKMAWLPNKSALIMAARKNFGDNNQFWRVSYPAMQITRVTQDLIDYLDLSVASGADKAVASQSTRISDIWVGRSGDLRNLKKITQAIDNFCWTPSGQIVYSSKASGNVDLWIMQPDGTGQRQLTVHPATDGTPAITPDRRYIVFMSNRTGPFQVWRMNLDGSNQIQLTNGTGKNHPAISPDGKWILYNTTDDSHLWRVLIDGGEPVRLYGIYCGSPGGVA